MTNPQNEDAAMEAIYRHEADCAGAEAVRMRDPEAALVFLREVHGGDEEGGEVPAPTLVREVLDVVVEGSSVRMKARVVGTDGVERTVDAFLCVGRPSCEDGQPVDVDVSYSFVE